MGLNTLFASVLPLALLLFLNVRTAAELFKMGNTDTAADPRGELQYKKAGPRLRECCRQG